MLNKVVLPSVELVSAFGGQCALYTRCSPAKDTSNQDAAAIVPHSPYSGAIVVADGLGGLRSGEVAADIAVSAICESIQRLALAGGDLPEVIPASTDDVAQSAAGGSAGASHHGSPRLDRRQEPMSRAMRDAILDGLDCANARILSEANGSATTVSVIEIQDNEIRSYHVGDSSALVCGQRGKLKFLTVSHSPVGFAVEAGVIDDEEAMHHEARHLVSNVVGCREMKIELGPTLHLAAKDTLLLATDGLFDNLHVSEIVERVRKGPLSQAVARLARDATERMLNSAPGYPSKPDDLTMVAFRLDR